MTRCRHSPSISTPWRRQEGRREGQVVIRREVPEERRGDADAGGVARAERRGEKAGLAPDRRVGVEEVAAGRRSARRRTPAARSRSRRSARRWSWMMRRRLDLPERRTVRMIEAGLAGGVDAPCGRSSGCRRAARPIAAAKRRPVDRQDVEAADEAVAEIVGDVDAVGGDDVAAGLQQAHAARCDQPAGLLVVGDLGRLRGRRRRNRSPRRRRPSPSPRRSRRGAGPPPAASCRSAVADGDAGNRRLRRGRFQARQGTARARCPPPREATGIETPPPVSSVLLVQQRRRAEAQRDDGGQPGGYNRVDDAVPPQITDNFSQDIKQKAANHTSEDKPQRAAITAEVEGLRSPRPSPSP